MVRRNDDVQRDGIQTTLGVLVGASDALGRLLALRLPVKTAYHLAKLSGLVAAEAQHFHKQRIALIKELGVERPATADEQAQGTAGPITQVPIDRMVRFTSQLDELAALEVSIAWRPVAIADLGDSPITASDLMALGPLVVGEEA